MACRDIVCKAMAKDPDSRYPDAGGLAAALRQVVSGAESGHQVAISETYRALNSVVVVEPSRMQAMRFERALSEEPVRILIVDDSALYRRLLQEAGLANRIIKLPDLPSVVRDEVRRGQ